jgi:hypothetical protein
MPQHCSAFSELFAQLVIVLALDDVGFKLLCRGIKIAENSPFVVEETLPVVKARSRIDVRDES